MSLSASALHIERGEHCVISTPPLRVAAGQMLQLGGANGSGKTTLMRALAGLVRPDSGSVDWHGEPILGHPAFRAELAYVGHLTGLSAALTPRENLHFAQRLSGAADAERVAAALRKVDALAFADVQTRHLSQGQKQRAALARLLLHPRRLWMLDEPFTALDRGGREQFESLIDAHLDDGGLVVVATHQSFDTRHAADVLLLDQPQDES